MALITPIKRALGKFKMFASGDYVHYNNLGSGGTNSGLKVLLDNNTFASPPSGNLVYSNTAVSAAIANTTVETAFNNISYTIPANTFVAGTILRVKLWGFYSTALVAPTITVRLDLGGVTYVSSGAVSGVAGVTNAGWTAVADITCFTAGSSGTIQADAFGQFATAATTGLSVNATNTATQTLNTTVSQAVTVTIQWSAASASNTIVCSQAQLFIENISTAAAAGTFLQVANNLSDLNSAVTARTNLGGVITGSVMWGFTNTGGLAFADVTNYFFGQFRYLSANPVSTSTSSRFIFPSTGTKIDMNFHLVVGTTPTSETGTWVITNVTTGLSVTVTSSYVTATGQSQYLSNSLVFSANDIGEVKFTTPAYATNPTISTISGQLSFK